MISRRPVRSDVNPAMNDKQEPKLSAVWTPYETDVVLKTILVAMSREGFVRACQTAAGLIGRPSSSIKRYVWGLATGLRPYIVLTEVRTPATGQWSWAEKQFIRWYTKTASVEVCHRRAGSKETQTLAALLQRPEKEVEEAIIKYGPARGRKGFGL